MSSRSATLRASCASSIVQHPRAPLRDWPGCDDRARCTPTTSCPPATTLDAATDESTPPLIAARTRISRSPSRDDTLAATREASGPGPLDDGPDRLDEGVDVRSGRGVPEREAQ